MRRPSEIQLRSLLKTRLARLIDDPIRQDPQGSSILEPPQTVQDAIVEVVRKLRHAGWLAYLVGGTLRDLLVHGETDRCVQPRDVDIIVEGTTRDQLQDLIGHSLSLERLTRFGGLHLIRSLASGSHVQFDVWILADTWGFHSQLIKPRIEDFPGTTFLNIDSCAFELLEPQGRERALFEKGFFAGIADRTLDVNYAPNPYPYVCAARALLLAAELDFTIARPLAEFILRHSANGGVQALVEAQQSHYGSVRSNANDLSKWLRDIETQVDSGRKMIRIAITDARRRKLRGEIPVADSHNEYTTSH